MASKRKAATERKATISEPDAVASHATKAPRPVAVEKKQRPVECWSCAEQCKGVAEDCFGCDSKLCSDCWERCNACDDLITKCCSTEEEFRREYCLPCMPPRIPSASEAEKGRQEKTCTCCGDPARVASYEGNTRCASCFGMGCRSPGCKARSNSGGVDGLCHQCTFEYVKRARKGSAAVVAAMQSAGWV
jgi:hypothetical protein